MKGQFPKGMIPWNKGKRLHYSAWNKGIPMADSSKALLSSAAKGRVSGNKGKKVSLEALERMKMVLKGKPWSESRREAQKLVILRPKNPKTKPVTMRGREYHPLWHEIRKIVYKRDNWLCQECMVHCNNSNKRKIQCHHIDNDTTNNDFSNLITLCASCHRKAHFGKFDWMNHFYLKTKGKINHGGNHHRSDC